MRLCLLRSMCSGYPDGTFVIGIVDKDYIDSYQISYPIVFSIDPDREIINAIPGNLSGINTITDSYSINFLKIKFLYDLNEDFIPNYIKQFYINYLRIQNINYYEQKQTSSGGFFDDEFDLDS